MRAVFITPPRAGEWRFESLVGRFKGSLRTAAKSSRSISPTDLSEFSFLPSGQAASREDYCGRFAGVGNGGGVTAAGGLSFISRSASSTPRSN
jgi:hypothetical protein